MCYNGRNIVFPSDRAIPCGPKEKFGACVQALLCEMETLKGDLLYNQQCLWGSLQIVVSPQTSLMVSYVFLSLFSKQTPHFGGALSLLSGKVHMPDVVAFCVIQWLHSAGRGPPPRYEH